MFYPEKITQIKETDIVLEIGPGSTPFQRSDVFLEMRYDDVNIAKSQRGEIDETFTTKKPIIYYDGNEFPFKNKEFDYVICSHVVEHVPNVELFLSECIRVGKKGYFEYPTIYFEYINNIQVHLNIQKFNSKTKCFYYKSKKELNVDQFLPIQQFLSEGMNKGYIQDLYDFIIAYSIEGFEWEGNFNFKKSNSIYDLCEENFNHIPTKSKEQDYSVHKNQFTRKFKNIVKSLIRILQ